MPMRMVNWAFDRLPQSLGLMRDGRGGGMSALGEKVSMANEHRLRRLRTVVCCLAIAAGVVVLFARFVIKQRYFPGDFSYAYHANSVFFTSAMRHGVFPEWVPYQSCGYPSALNLQSGYYYPPYVLAGWLGVPLSLTLNSLLQVLHVYFAAVGCFFLLRYQCGGHLVPLIGGLAFTFFGGFFTNAIHPDYVRGFSFVPWLMLCVLASPERLTGLRFLFPILIYLVFTGAYPGQIVAVGLTLSLGTVIQAVQHRGDRTALGNMLAWGAMGLLGLCLAAVAFVPGVLLNSYQVRSAIADRNTLQAAQFQDFAAYLISPLFLPRGHGLDVTMGGVSVTVPLIFLAFFIRWADVRRNAVALGMGAFALLMGLGYSTPLWPTIACFMRTAGVSRFAFGDYRIFLSLLILILGAHGAANVLQMRLSLRDIAARSALYCVASLLLLGHSLTVEGHYQFKLPWPLWVELAIFGLSSFILVVGLILHRSGWISTPAVVGGIIGLVIAGGLVSATGQRFCWTSRNPRYAAEITEATRKAAAFPYVVSTRGRREQIETAFPTWMWKGYYDGSFITTDWGGPKLIATSNLLRDDRAREYLCAPWRAVLCEASVCSGRACTVDPHLLGSPGQIALTDNLAGEVLQESYSINRIVYRVQLPSTRLMIENEVYFPGWHAWLRDEAGRETVVQAVNVNEGLRGWLLPAGDYAMDAVFETPFRRPCFAISRAALGILLLLIGRELIFLFVGNYGKLLSVYRRR